VIVLIDSSGKITYAADRFDEPALRATIAKLGPEFSSISTQGKAEKTAPSPPQ